MNSRLLACIFFILFPSVAFSLESEHSPEVESNGLGLVELKLLSDGEPSGARAHNDRGITYAQTGQLQQAIVEFKKARRISPSDAAVAFNLGVAHARAKDYVSGLKYLREAVKLCPDNAAAFFNMGVIHLDMGMPRAAIEELQRALFLSPDHPLIHYNLGIAYEYGQSGIRYSLGFPYQKSLEHYHRAIEGGLDNVAVRYNMGIIHSQRGDYEKAEAEFTKACELDPDFTLARRDLAVALIHSGKYYRAIGELERAMTANDDIEISSALAFAHRKLGRFFLDNGDYERALIQFRKALRYNKDDASAYLNIGRINIVLGDYDEAMRDLNIAAQLDAELDIDEHLAKMHFLRGMEFEKKGYCQLALAEYTKAVDIKQDFVLAHLVMGELYAEKLGKREEAIQHFKRCLELESEGTYARHAEEMISALGNSSEIEE